MFLRLKMFKGELITSLSFCSLSVKQHRENNTNIVEKLNEKTWKIVC